MSTCLSTCVSMCVRVREEEFVRMCVTCACVSVCVHVRVCVCVCVYVCWREGGRQSLCVVHTIYLVVCA